MRSECARRVDVGAARDVLLEDVVLDRARQRRERHALPPRHGDVERQQDDRRRVDRHRRRDAVERDAVEQRRHVLDRVDRDADAADFARGQRVVGVVAHLRRQVEGDAQAADALREQVPVARVRFGRRAEPGVLPHRPQPAAVHRRLDAARERETRRAARRRGSGRDGRGRPAATKCRGIVSHSRRSHVSTDPETARSCASADVLGLDSERSAHSERGTRDLCLTLLTTRVYNARSFTIPQCLPCRFRLAGTSCSTLRQKRLPCARSRAVLPARRRVEVRMDSLVNQLARELTEAIAAAVG